MHPYLIRIPLPGGGHYPIASYGTMILCGFVLCLWLMRRRGRRMGIEPDALFDAAVTTLLCGIVGARIYYVAENWSAYSDDLWQLIRLDRGGLAFFGGLIGGTLGFAWTAFSRRLPVLASLDVAASLVPLAHAFGRVGCFLNGCCYGHVTESALGVQFPRHLEAGSAAYPLLNLDGQYIAGCPAFADQVTVGWSGEQFRTMMAGFSEGFAEKVRAVTFPFGDRFLLEATESWSLPVHPTQLYAVVYNLAIFGVLSYLLMRRWRRGEIAWLYLVFYGAARYANEFFRGDHVRHAALGGMTEFQAICLGAVVVGAALVLAGRRKPYEPLPGPWVPPDEADAEPSPR